MISSPKKGALILLSGGLDSATVLKIVRDENYIPIALSFNYGQRHLQEIKAAERLAQHYAVPEHIIVKLDPCLFSGSALVGRDLEIPHNRTIAEEIPVTYVPARNFLFLAHALALAESRNISDVFIGVNALDYSGYPDCRPEFIAAFEKAAVLGTKRGVLGEPIRIRTPLIHMNKADIIREGIKRGVDYSMTFSCYDPDAEEKACGTCDSCTLRARGFAAVGIKDPLLQEKIP